MKQNVEFGKDIKAVEMWGVNRSTWSSLTHRDQAWKKCLNKKSLAGDKKESERIFEHKGERRQKFKMKAYSLVRNNLR